VHYQNNHYLLATILLKKKTGKQQTYCEILQFKITLLLEYI